METSKTWRSNARIPAFGLILTKQRDSINDDWWLAMAFKGTQHSKEWSDWVDCAAILVKLDSSAAFLSFSPCE